MIEIDSETAQILAWERQKLEIAMCQQLANVYDRDMTPFMTILGRMSVFNIKKRLAGLSGELKRQMVDNLAKEAIVYAPIKLIVECEGLESQGAKPLRKEGNIDAIRKVFERAILWDKALMLHPKYPWGVLTLGGMGRLYAEVSENIYNILNFDDALKAKWLKKSKFQNGKKLSEGATPDPSKTVHELVDVRSMPEWMKTAVIEEEGRVSWQKKLMDLQKPTGQLFSKGQPKEKKDILQAFKTGQPGKDRERYAWKPDIVPEHAKKNLGNGYVKTFKDTLESLEPPWTGAGRLRWQTFATDRISLLGDIFGLVRGATISGTTSDHLYTFWQLLHSAKEAYRDKEKSKVLVRPVKKGAKIIYSEKDMKGALSAITRDVGWKKIAGLIQLVPLIQMGIELHHSVHEMASVLGLNDLIKYKIGYYESLMTHLEIARGSVGVGRGRYSDIDKSKAKGKLNKVEGNVKKILKNCQKNVMHGYFKTIDPALVEVVDKEWGGCIMEDKEARGSQVKRKHENNASVNEKLIIELEKDINQKRITNQGITSAYLRDKGYFKSTEFKKMGHIAIKQNVKPGEKYAKISKKGDNILIKEQSVNKIGIANDKIWERYKNLYKG